MFLELKKVTKRYGEAGSPESVEVLKGVDLALKKGDTVAILGPSGSGKSTLLNMAGGLDRPTGGSVALDGVNLSTLPDDELARVRNLRIGFVFQLHHLLPQCTVLENVLLPALAGYGEIPAEKVRDRALALLERVGLIDRLHHPPSRLSGGELQRTAVVRALIMKPGLLLADEPTGSLDRANAKGLAYLLSELNREEETTLIAVTHSEEFAEQLGKTLTLRDGRLVK
ncbi:MAG: ABC transporter ATP-binding protein [Planctomycetota bacterium]